MPYFWSDEKCAMEITLMLKNLPSFKIVYSVHYSEFSFALLPMNERHLFCLIEHLSIMPVIAFAR